MVLGSLLNFTSDMLGAAESASNFAANPSLRGGIDMVNKGSKTLNRGTKIAKGVSKAVGKRPNKRGKAIRKRRPKRR